MNEHERNREFGLIYSPEFHNPLHVSKILIKTSYWTSQESHHSLLNPTNTPRCFPQVMSPETQSNRGPRTKNRRTPKSPVYWSRLSLVSAIENGKQVLTTQPVDLNYGTRRARMTTMLAYCPSTKTCSTRETGKPSPQSSNTTKT